MTACDERERIGRGKVDERNEKMMKRRGEDERREKLKRREEDGLT